MSLTQNINSLAARIASEVKNKSSIGHTHDDSTVTSVNWSKLQNVPQTLDALSYVPIVYPETEYDPPTYFDLRVHYSEVADYAEKALSVEWSSIQNAPTDFMLLSSYYDEQNPSVLLMSVTSAEYASTADTANSANVANVANSVTWANVSGKPTSVTGYGIADVYTKTQIDTALAGKANAATTISGYGITDAYTRTQIDTSLAGKANVATTLAGYGITNAVSTALIGVANGVVPLDSTTKIPSAYLPSYVDDVLEYAALANFPASGETGKIYIDIAASKIYRWTGSVYIEISPTAGNSDTATKLAIVRTISVTGDATWSVSFDGSANATGALTLASSGVTAGTYNNSSTAITPYTVDSKGRITATGTAVTITPAWSSITGKPTALSSFSNDVGYVTSSGSVSYATTSGSTSTATTANVAKAVQTTDPGVGTGGLWVTSATGLNIARNSTSYIALDTGNYTSYAPSLTGSGASGTWGISISGNAASASVASSANAVTWANVSAKPARATWAGLDSLQVVVGQLGWKHFGNGHTIFDASNGTAPDGTAINNTNSSSAWSATYPTLMGWNGTGTYGVRVDTARYSESSSWATTAGTANAVTWANVSSKPTTISGYGITDAVSVSSPTFNSKITIVSAGNAAIEIGRVDGVASNPYIDFHSGATATDYDARIIASGGNGVAGAGTLTVECGSLVSTGNIQASQAYTTGWFRNSVSGNGLFNEATSAGIFSDAAGWMKTYNGSNFGITGDELNVGLGLNASEKRVRFNTTGRNVYLFCNSNNDFGLFDATGGYTRWNSDVNGGMSIRSGLTIGGNVAVHAGNISSYVSGNTYSVSAATGGAYVWSGAQQFISNKGASSYIGSNHSYTLQAFSSDGGAAAMSFHRGNAYAVNMGLDPDNVFRIGGWSAGANLLQMDMSGNLTMANNVTAYSDIRLKKDFVVIENALQKVRSLCGYTFTRTDIDGVRQTGLIAQEVQKVIPEAVIENSDEMKTLSVAYGNLAGLFVEAIKDVDDKVDALERLVVKQQEMIEMLYKHYIDSLDDGK